MPICPERSRKPAHVCISFDYKRYRYVAWRFRSMKVMASRTAHSRQLALLYAARTRSPKPPFEQRCSNISIAAIPGSTVATMQHALTSRQRLARPLPGGMLALPGARGCLIDFYLTSVEAEVEGRASTWGASKNHNLT
jgi:hypothetical protein